MKYFTIIVVLLVVFQATSYSQTARYVSPGGDDNNDGSIDTPWRTLQYALNQMDSGDTLVVLGGIYDVQGGLSISSSLSGSSQQPTIIEAQGNVQLYSDKSASHYISLSGSADNKVQYVIIRGFSMVNYPVNYGIRATHAEHCIFENNMISCYIGIALIYSNNCIVDNNHCGEVTAYRREVLGIYCYDSDYNVISNNICSNNISEEYAWMGIGISLYVSSHNEVRDNICYRNMQIGYGNGSNGIGAGIFLRDGSHNILCRNILEANCNKIRDNKLEIKSRYGVYNRGDVNAVITGNMLKDNQICIEGADNCEIGNNSFIQTYIEWSRFNTVPSSLHLVGNVDNIDIRNNFFYQKFYHSPATLSLPVCISITSPSEVENESISANIFYSSQQPIRTALYSAQSLSSLNLTDNFYCGEILELASDYDNDSTGNRYSIAPLFRNDDDNSLICLPAYNFQQLEGSPCMGAGIYVFGDGDSDCDGMPDAWEMNAGLDVTLQDDNTDLDNDGLTNFQEYSGKTNPLNYDTDNDGIADGVEYIKGYNPKSSDSDLDMINDYLEDVLYPTSPVDADFDQDGVKDGAELYIYHTDQITADSDADGLKDGSEIFSYKTNPLDNDSDDDMLFDGIETNSGTNPLDSDTDDDKLIDSVDRLPLDHDNDRLRDSQDEDDDADCISDSYDPYLFDSNNNGIKNVDETDVDGDGVDDDVDMFIFDPSEWADNNDNGIGDNYEAGADLDPLGDDDNDGANNYEEFIAGTEYDNDASILCIQSMVKDNGKIIIRWNTVPGRQYLVISGYSLSNIFSEVYNADYSSQFSENEFSEDENGYFCFSGQNIYSSQAYYRIVVLQPH
ncbi:MAG: right-handed parallel beta-helix repeat-containing protein [Candidatus Auribacterota bacterium]